MKNSHEKQTNSSQNGAENNDKSYFRAFIHDTASSDIEESVHNRRKVVDS